MSELTTPREALNPQNKSYEGVKINNYQSRSFLETEFRESKYLQNGWIAAAFSDCAKLQWWLIEVIPTGCLKLLKCRFEVLEFWRTENSREILYFRHEKEAQLNGGFEWKFIGMLWDKCFFIWVCKYGLCLIILNNLKLEKSLQRERHEISRIRTIFRLQGRRVSVQITKICSGQVQIVIWNSRRRQRI